MSVLDSMSDIDQFEMLFAKTADLFRKRGYDQPAFNVECRIGWLLSGGQWGFYWSPSVNDPTRIPVLQAPLALRISFATKIREVQTYLESVMANRQEKLENAIRELNSVVNG